MKNRILVFLCLMFLMTGCLMRPVTKRIDDTNGVSKRILTMTQETVRSMETMKELMRLTNEQMADLKHGEKLSGALKLIKGSSFKYIPVMVRQFIIFLSEVDQDGDKNGEGLSFYLGAAEPLGVRDFRIKTERGDLRYRNVSLVHDTQVMCEGAVISPVNLETLMLCETAIRLAMRIVKYKIAKLGSNPDSAPADDIEELQFLAERILYAASTVFGAVRLVAYDRSVQEPMILNDEPVDTLMPVLDTFPPDDEFLFKLETRKDIARRIIALTQEATLWSDENKASMITEIEGRLGVRVDVDDNDNVTVH